jgi:hypothetical protein
MYIDYKIVTCVVEEKVYKTELIFSINLEWS